MINKSKLALIAVLAAMSVASPAFAQAFSKGYGTGNVTPYAFEPSGTTAPQNGQTATRSSNAGKVPFIRTATADSPIPARSTGCNKMFLRD
jgi:hypothetical protein